MFRLWRTLKPVMVRLPITTIAKMKYLEGHCPGVWESRQEMLFRDDRVLYSGLDSQTAFAEKGCRRIGPCGSQGFAERDGHPFSRRCGRRDLMSKRRAMKILFDRSAFHKGRFDLLQQSRLLQLTRDKKVLVFYTTVLLDETLRMIDSSMADVRSELKRQWPFLRSICNGGYFRPLLFAQPPMRSICDDELSGAVRDGNWPLLPPQVLGIVQAKLGGLIEEGKPLQELDEARPIYDIIWQKKQQSQTLLVGLRNRPATRKGETFAQYYQSEADLYASRAIQHMAVDLPDIKLKAWSQDPRKFRHFTDFVEVYTYVHYDAQRNQNSKLDSNWLGDAEQLCFLEDTDAIVSSDDKFMKRAFEELWRPRGKRMLTPEEFVKLLNQAS